MTRYPTLPYQDSVLYINPYPQRVQGGSVLLRVGEQMDRLVRGERVTDWTLVTGLSLQYIL